MVILRAILILLLCSSCADTEVTDSVHGWSPEGKKAELVNSIQLGDEYMLQGSPLNAFTAYQGAWSDGELVLSEEEKVWLLLSIANASLRSGNFEAAWQSLNAALTDHADSGVVVGNPMFHLLFGLAYDGLGEDPESETEHLARALITGGPDIFNGESRAHLLALKRVLLPPAELGTWDGYKGCCRENLNGATGYMLEVIVQKLGEKPPYVY